MIDKILEFSLRQRVFVLLGAVGILAFGGWSVTRLPIDAVPDITNVQVQINTEVIDLAPEESERLVTFPIETELAGVQGITEMRSTTKFGLSQVTLEFRDGTDIYRARQLVNERLQNVMESLPPGIVPKLAPISTGLGEIIYYTVDYAGDSSHKPATREAQLMALKTIQDYTIKPLLRSVQGVAEINSAGGYDKQIVVEPDQDALREAGLTLGDLGDAISQNVANVGGGLLHQAREQIVIRTVGRIETPEEIESIPIQFGSRPDPIHVGDVAKVSVGTRVRTGAATENGREAVLGTVMMLVGENTRIVAERVKEAIAEINDGKLPEGVQIQVVYDRSNVVDRTIETVKRNLFEGAILVIVVLLLLLGNLRAALIVSLAIPLSFLMAICGMVQGKVSGNLMSLGAVDFGLIIDGAVVIVENIVRRLAIRQHELGRPLNLSERSHVVLSASRQVANPMVFGVLIITIVYIPILALSGVEGKMFRPMAITVMMALGGALVLAVTLMPALCAFLLGGRLSEKENFFLRGCKAIYAPVLGMALKFRYLVFLAGIGICVYAVLVFGRLGAEFVPQLNEGSFTAMVYKTASASLETSLEMECETEQIILSKVPEIERVFSRIGSSEIATDPMPPNENDLYIFYKPESTWRMENGVRITKARLSEIITEEVQKLVPGQDFMWAQPIEMKFNEMLEGIRSDIAVKIFGDDYNILEKKADEIIQVLQKIPGAANVEFESNGRIPVMEVRLDRKAMSHLNVHAAEVNRVVAAALGGEVVGTLLEGNRQREIVVRFGHDHRQDIRHLRGLRVRTGDGQSVPIEKVTHFELVPQVDAINRELSRRRAAIMVNIEGRDVESFVAEARQHIREEVEFPEGYYIDIGGQFENLQAARERLMFVVPTALAFIFLLVFAALGSLRQAALVYTGIPLAMTGGIFALALRGMPFSISAAVGFIALSGVAVLNGLVLINYFNELREEGAGVRDAVITGALTRLRPVLMTALVASLGFLPMAIATGAGAEVQRPLATVVIGGILTSTCLTLVLLPALYYWVESLTVPKQAE